MSAKFYSSQLSTICLCGSPKEFGSYVCDTCWHHVPEDLKKELSSTDSNPKDDFLKRLDAIASGRNPDLFEGALSTIRE